MKIEIFDVEHGQCAMIHCPNGKKLMVDAGHNASKPWHPSIHFAGQHIEQLIITNYDHDHTSDLPGVWDGCHINAITRNLTISSASLAAMKADYGMGPGIKRVYQWLRNMEAAPGGFTATIDLGQVWTRSYCNNYGFGPGQFTDANNLSVVTFVTYAGFCILFPGDLEVAGWLKLLENPNFCADLERVTVLVASHHGRANGCCDEIYDYCSPQATVISDAGKQHSTQDTVNWYAYRSGGFQDDQGNSRSVLTTRSDGTITIDVNAFRADWTVKTKSYAAPAPAFRWI